MSLGTRCGFALYLGQMRRCYFTCKATMPHLTKYTTKTHRAPKDLQPPNY